MPGTGPKSYPCVLCNKRTTPNDRYKIKSQHATIIEKKFLQKTTKQMKMFFAGNADISVKLNHLQRKKVNLILQVQVNHARE